VENIKLYRVPLPRGDAQNIYVTNTTEFFSEIFEIGFGFSALAPGEI
jgi:hypothetical protein